MAGMISGEFITWLHEEEEEAERDAAESAKEARNSYGAGYDRGFADALSHVLRETERNE